MSLAQEQLKASQFPLLEFFDIDTGDGILRYTPDSRTSSNDVIFNGNLYQSVPIQITGTKHQTGETAPPQPMLTVSNIVFLLQGKIINDNDMLGMNITRTRTFSNNLANTISPDTTFLLVDQFIIFQKTYHSKKIIQFKLVTLLDTKLHKLPRRKVYRKDFPGVGATRVLL